MLPMDAITFSGMTSKTTALITGASAGIGLELAKQFASHGHDLILVARNRDALEAVAGTLEGRHGIKATVITSDLADPNSPQRLFEAVMAEVASWEIASAKLSSVGVFTPKAILL